MRIFAPSSSSPQKGKRKGQLLLPLFPFPPLMALELSYPPTTTPSNVLIYAEDPLGCVDATMPLSRAMRSPTTCRLATTIFLLLGFASQTAAFTIHHDSRAFRSPTYLYYGQEGKASPDPNLIISSPVLQKVYPHILEYMDQYGHPNIPLGTPEGRQCQTLRRLHTQKKLSEAEVEWLDSLGFTWHSLEEVYKHADFDELFQRLQAYEAAHPESNFQIPKKCKEDPELGAWVTGIRRLGKDGVNPEHERRLDSIGFAWQSTRKCGSAFMEQYRKFNERLEKDESLSDLLQETATIKWIQAQQEALKRGQLSQTRVHYMGQMFGEDWTTVGKQVGPSP